MSAAFEDSTKANSSPVLEVEGLEVVFRSDNRIIKAVSGVSFTLGRGETLAIAGESGSGKSVTAQAVMGLIDSPPGYVIAGDAKLHGQSLFANNGKLGRKARGRQIGMVFQDALAALNPGFTIGFQIAELFRVHVGCSRADAKRRTIELVDRVGIPNAADRVGDYPHQFSGGMRQRIAIAMAIALEPSVIIADEPTTALDVTIQAQIMDLLDEIKNDTGAGIILITHDLAVVATYATRLAVMYASRIVEEGPASDVIKRPSHPYTQGLINSVPASSAGNAELIAIPGQPPDLGALPSGCAFEPRCHLGNGRERCIEEHPKLRDSRDRQRSACHFVEECLEATEGVIGHG